MGAIARGVGQALAAVAIGALVLTARAAEAYLVAAYDSPGVEAIVAPEDDIHAAAVLSEAGELLIVLDVLDVAPLQGGAALRFRTGTHVLPPGAIDYRETWLLNVGRTPGNVLWMATGRFIAYDSVRVADGRIVVSLGEGAEVAVDQSAVDFRTTVLEGARAEVAVGAGAQVGIAKSVPTRRTEIETTRQPSAEAQTGTSSGSRRIPGGSERRQPGADRTRRPR